MRQHPTVLEAASISNQASRMLPRPRRPCAAMGPALPCVLSCSSALTGSTAEWNRTRLPCRVMPDRPMAVARWVFPVPGPPTSTTFARVVCEGRRGKLGDERAVHRRDLEVEACQVAVHRESCRVHLVADRAHRAVRGLGLQQVLDEPARGLDASSCARTTALLAWVSPGDGHAVHRSSSGSCPSRSRPKAPLSSACLRYQTSDTTSAKCIS